jgi:hypothetical protein
MFIVILHLSAYKDGTECSETSAYKIQTPGNYLEESTQDEIKLEQYFWKIHGLRPLPAET